MRFGYDGAGFFGWAQQPGRRTVEGEILAELRRLRLRGASSLRRIDVASRTDRGVSARANALLLESELSGSVLLRALNGLAPEIFFTHAHRVPPGFRPRNATGRSYRYLEPSAGHDLDRWRRTAARLVGRIDVRSFGRGIPTDRPCWRDVRRVSVVPKGDWIQLDVEAPSFVWGMVRKLVAALRAVDQSSLSEAALERALAGDTRLTLPMAEPEGLILWEVSYPFEWEVAADRYTGHQLAYWSEQRREAARRSAVIEELTGHLPRPTERRLKRTVRNRTPGD